MFLVDKPGALVLTNWFDASKFNPGSVGVYQVNSSPIYALRYSYWDGAHWCCCASTISEAHGVSDASQSAWAVYPVRAFRGLLNKPE